MGKEPMTYMVLCLPTPDKKGKICIKIPQAIVRQWGPPEPNGDPLKQIKDWIISEEPPPCPWKVDLPILATIDTLLSHVQNRRVREQLGKTVEDATQQVAADL